jgi:hypothetical protein
MGDSFDLTLLALPVARSGAIGFDEVQISTPRDSYYIRRVRKALARSFNQDLRIDVRDQARRLLEQERGTSSYRQELDDFKVSRIAVSQDAIVLQVDFKLIVK